MSTEMAVPFAIDPTGSVATTDNLAQQMVNHLVSIIGTNINERLMNPDYGVDTDAFLFNGDDTEHQSLLINDVSLAITTYEPGVEVMSIAVVPDPAEPTELAIQVSFQLVTAGGTTGAQVYTATVTSTGAVVGSV